MCWLLLLDVKLFGFYSWHHRRERRGMMSFCLSLFFVIHQLSCVVALVSHSFCKETVPCFHKGVSVTFSQLQIVFQRIAATHKLSQVGVVGNFPVVRVRYQRKATMFFNSCVPHGGFSFLFQSSWSRKHFNRDPLCVYIHILADKIKNGFYCDLFGPKLTKAEVFFGEASLLFYLHCRSTKEWSIGLAGLLLGKCTT